MRDILFISYYFPPRGGSGVQRSAKFAKYLPDYGYRPHVITCNIEDIVSSSDSTVLRELDGIPIYRACGGEMRVSRLRKRGLGFAVSLGLRPDPQILWRRNALPFALEIAARTKLSAIYTTVRPFSSALVGLELKRRLNIPWILDFRDPWVGSSGVAWPTRLHYLIDSRYEARCVQEADAIVSVSPGMIEALRRRYPWAADKLFLIPNGFDAEDFMNNRQPSRQRHSRRVRIACTGHLHSVGLDTTGRSNAGLDLSTHSARYLLEAMSLAIAERPEMRDVLALELAGRVADDNLNYAESLGLGKNVRYHGMLSHGEAIQLVSKCDAAFLPLKSERDGSRSCLESGEVYDYLAQRKPILACVPEGDVAEVVREARAGWVINPYDVQAMKGLLIEMVQRKRYGPLEADHDDAYIAQFDRRRLTGKLGCLLDSLLTYLPEPVQLAS